ncbi:hypothetical protein IAT38_005181 [Cryptococcus sp. DSM 104549]
MVALTALAAILGLASLAQAAPSEYRRRDNATTNFHPQVQTAYGGVEVTYQGLLNTTTNVEQFLAIPYAQPPVGSLRFKPPQPWAPGSETLLDATSHGPSCKQPGRNASAEDCLHLNIARHTGVKSEEKLPVLVWIHGGDYISGAGDDELYNPAQLVLDSINMDAPIILVSINYRLSAYGGLIGQQAIEANATNTGIRDQRMALEWLQKHIHAFGGDPDEVTIFGASAGGGSVVGQLILEGMEPKGLFSAAMHMSGAFIWNWERAGLVTYQSDLYTSTNCVGEPDPVECMRHLSEDDLFSAVSAIGSNEFGDNFGPTWGDALFPERPTALIKKGYLAEVPLITGDTSDEFSKIVPYLTNTSVEAAGYMSKMILTLTGQDASVLWPYYINLDTDLSPRANETYATATYAPYYQRLTTAATDIFFVSSREFLIQTQLNRSMPVWAYNFEQPADPYQYGAPHYADISWWFGSTPRTDPGQQTLGNGMRKALISFANTHDPAAISGVQWDQYSKDGSLIRWLADETGMVVNDAHRAQFDAILDFVL